MGWGKKDPHVPDPTFSHRSWHHRFTAQLVESLTPQERMTETFAMAAGGSYCPHLTQKFSVNSPEHKPWLELTEPQNTHSRGSPY